MNKIREDISKWPLEKRVDFLKQAFKKKMGYDLDLENPRTFSEKIQWIKLFYRDPQMSRCADKVTFKDYIKEKLGRDDLTAELYIVWESPEEVDLSKIPDRCVIKSNCSSDGWNIKLVPDKSKVDLKALEAEIKESWFDRLALHTNSFANYYYAVKPKVYVEEYLADFADSADDYDVLCFHGEPKVICVKSNHFDNGKNLLDYPYTFYTTDWERMDVKYAINPTLEEVKRPAHLEEMLEISRTLSKDFPFVRVDFYEHDSKLRIAEFSFAPYAGMVHYEPEEFDREMGEWLNLSECRKNELIADIKTFYEQYLYVKDIIDVYLDAETAEEKLGKAKTFFMMSASACVDSFFMTLARLYDVQRDSRTIYSLLKICKYNSSVFDNESMLIERINEFEKILKKSSIKETIDVIIHRRNKYFAHNDKIYFRHDKVDDSAIQDRKRLSTFDICSLVIFTGNILKFLAENLDLNLDENMRNKYTDDLKELVNDIDFDKSMLWCASSVASC